MQPLHEDEKCLQGVLPDNARQTGLSSALFSQLVKLDAVGQLRLNRKIG